MSETKAQMQERLGAASERIADALQFMQGPTGEVIHVGEKLLHMAWHLARAGGDVHPENAIIKRRPIPARPGQFAGMCQWVPLDAPEVDNGAELVSAVGSSDIDLNALDDAIPWHVKTHISGGFK
jgi:3-oxoacyl-ACP reductase-like protein